MAENKLKVSLIGIDKSLSKTLRGAGHSVKTLSGSLKMLGKGLLMLGGIAIAGVVAAIIGMIAFVVKAKEAYEGWMQTLDDMQDVTGMSAKATSLLAFQARMADADVGAVTKGVGIFTKVLDGARRGVEANLEPFKRLGIHIKDSDGKLRSLDDVLFEARDRLSEVKDQVTRNGIAAKLFGKGFASMADWLDKSAKEMERYVKWAEELGMVMGEKSMKAFQKYRQNQRKLSVGWDAIKINAYGALVPLINDIMPGVIRVIWKAAGWVKKFRNQVTKKGWAKAIQEMLPQLSSVWDLLKRGWAQAKKFYNYVIDHKAEIIAAFEDILTIINGIATAISTAIGLVKELIDALRIAESEKRGAGSAGQRGGGRGGGVAHRALGGPIYGPRSGYPIIAHGRETVVAHSDPTRGLVDLAKSGILAGTGGGAVNVNVIVPGGTTLIGTAQEVGNILAPHVARALGREQARAGRRR